MKLHGDGCSCPRCAAHAAIVQRIGEQLQIVAVEVASAQRDGNVRRLNPSVVGWAALVRETLVSARDNGLESARTSRLLDATSVATFLVQAVGAKGVR